MHNFELMSVGFIENCVVNFEIRSDAITFHRISLTDELLIDCCRADPGRAIQLWPDEPTNGDPNQRCKKDYKWIERAWYFFISFRITISPYRHLYIIFIVGPLSSPDFMVSINQRGINQLPSALTSVTDQSTNSNHLIQSHIEISQSERAMCAVAINKNQ